MTFETALMTATRFGSPLAPGASVVQVSGQRPRVALGPVCDVAAALTPSVSCGRLAGVDPRHQPVRSRTRVHCSCPTA